MTSLFFTTTAVDTPGYPWAHANFLRVWKASESNQNDRFRLANDPQSADVILFVEPRFTFQSDVLHAPLFCKFPEKSLVLDFGDCPEPVVPGMYVGLRRNQNQIEKGIFEGNAYIRVADNHRLERACSSGLKPDLLFSFVGRAANANRVRSAILNLRHSQALLLDRNSNQSESDDDYIQTLARSKFVLCPRGIGPSSWRLFETMRMGRVPVVISDDWVPPGGIDWESFVVRVPEAEVNSIPERLTELEPEWAARGRRARSEWERCLSYERLFGWIGERSTAIVERVQATSYKASLAKQIARVGSMRSAAHLVRERYFSGTWS